MSESLNSEILYLTCGHCGFVTSFSLGSLMEEENPACPRCGAELTVDLPSAEQDARRKAQELDHSVDSLGSIE